MHPRKGKQETTRNDWHWVPTAIHPVWRPLANESVVHYSQRRSSDPDLWPFTYSRPGEHLYQFWSLLHFSFSSYESVWDRWRNRGTDGCARCIMQPIGQLHNNTNDENAEQSIPDIVRISSMLLLKSFCLTTLGWALNRELLGTAVLSFLQPCPAYCPTNSVIALNKQLMKQYRNFKISIYSVSEFGFQDWSLTVLRVPRTQFCMFQSTFTAETSIT